LEQVLHGAQHYLSFDMQELAECTKCSRIVKNFSKLKISHPDYLNKPIIPILIKQTFLCIIGLAPGFSGANRTGKIFHGDFSGNILNKAIQLSNYKKQDKYTFPYITNAVKCFPPNNKPISSEINNCNIHLKNELESLGNLRVIIALGYIAHISVLRSYSILQKKHKFVHGAVHKINNNVVLIDSYHCSKINVYTKRITLSKLIDILKLAMSYR